MSESKSSSGTPCGKSRPKCVETGTSHTGGSGRWLRAIGRSGLATSLKTLLCAYVQYVNWDTGEARPSIDTLAGWCTLQPRRTRELIGILKELGILTVISAGGGR